ncbi:SUKH-3 domain-containing protein [Micromonospora sp. CPCC 205371]|nr:SUKH-3 domain-containing protein [Micromonospora sp. CPCC 205371]
MSERFAPDVEAALRDAGWHPGRTLDAEALAEMHRAVSAQSGVFGGKLTVSFAADPVLAEFGGLVIGGDREGLQVSPRPFAIDPRMAAHSVETLIDAGRALGTRLYPIGVEGDDEAVLAIASTGAVLAIDSVGEWLLGDTFDEALETLVTGRAPRLLPTGGIHEPDWLPPPPDELAQGDLLPQWGLKRPIGAAFYLPRTPANLHYVLLPSLLSRIGTVPWVNESDPVTFWVEWGGHSCEVRLLDLVENYTVLVLAFEQRAFRERGGQAVQEAFRNACAGLAPDLDAAFLHVRRVPNLLQVVVDRAYDVVTADGDVLVDQGFELLYLTDKMDYGVAPRDELPVTGGHLFAGSL